MLSFASSFAEPESAPRMSGAAASAVLFDDLREQRFERWKHLPRSKTPERLLRGRPNAVEFGLWHSPVANHRFFERPGAALRHQLSRHACVRAARRSWPLSWQ